MTETQSERLDRAGLRRGWLRWRAFSLYLSRAPGWGRSLALLSACLALAPTACATPVAAGPERLLSLGGREPTLGAPLLFVHQGYQHLARVPLPAGEHHLRRVWVLPAAAGTLLVEIYGESELQTPTEKIFEGTVQVGPGDVGHDAQGPWSVVELPKLAAPARAVWVGFRKKDGNPALWSSAAGHGGAYLRSVDPQDPLELLPLKHGAVFSLDVSP